MVKSILVVEDDENNLIVIRDILEHLLNQRELLVARDGHEAMRIAYEHHPDIILLDLTLPSLSGWDVARSLRNDKAFRETRILALTAHAMVSDREEALKAGCDDHFAKPIDVDRFVDFLQAYLDA